jgi:hypothetical protein
MKEAVVVFNSLLNATGSNNNNLTYKVDWSILDEGEYDLTFTYHGLNNHKTGAKQPIIYIDLGTTANTYQTSISNYSNQSLYLGTLLASEIISGDAQYYATLETNVPIHIKGKPNNQNPRIFVENIDGTPFTDSQDNELADYVLALCFKKNEY